MSTRAIITVKSADGKEVRRLYAHGDGYPSEVGKLVYYFSKFAPKLEGNSSTGKMQKVAFGDYRSEDPAKREGRYRQLPAIGQAYATMYNVTVDPDKFVPALVAYMTDRGYGGLYLTDRDPVKEAAERQNGQGGTDIEWHYVVTLGKESGATPRVEAFEEVSCGPKVSGWIGSDGKPVMIGSLSKFVSKGTDIPKLIETERKETAKRVAEYEKKEEDRKQNEGKTLGEPVSVLTPRQKTIRARKTRETAEVKATRFDRRQVGGIR